MIHDYDIPTPSINESPDARYVVMTAAACMPQSCEFGTYRRVAVLEVEPGAEPRMISKRARGVVRVVETWERRSVGTTDRCDYAQALAEAVELCARLNGDDPAVTL